MRFINVLSYKLANSLTKELGHTHEKRRVYYYGFQIVIGGIIKGILLVLITLLLGIFKATMSVLLFFAIPRMTAGGYHMDDYTKCMLTALGIFLSLGFIVKYTSGFWSVWTLIILSLIVFVTTLFCVIKYAPADTPYKPITKPEQKRKLKTLSIKVVMLWLAIDIVLLIYGLKYYILAGCLGMLLAAFFISPAGYKFFDFISGKSRRPISANISR